MLVLSVFSSINIQSQINVSVSNKIDLPKREKINFKNTSFFSINGQRFLISGKERFNTPHGYFGLKQITLSKMNSDFIITESETIKINDKRKNFIIEKVFEANDEIFVLSSSEDNSTKKVHFYLNKVNPNSLKLIGDLKLVGSVDFENVRKYYNFYCFKIQISKNENNKTFSITLMSTSNVKTQPVYNTYVFDDQGELKFHLNYNKLIKGFDYFDVEQVSLTDSGLVCLINNCIPKSFIQTELSPKPYNDDILSRGVAKDKSDYYLFLIDYKGRSSLLDIKGNFPEFDASMYTNGDSIFLVMLGNKSINNNYEFIIQKYSCKEQMLKSSKSLELSSSLLGAKYDKNKYSYLIIDRVILSPSGELYVLFQDYRRISGASTHSSSSLGSNGLVEVFGQIVLVSFNSENLNFNFVKKIIKESRSSDVTQGALITYFDTSNNLNIISNVSNLKYLIDEGISKVKNENINSFLSMKWKVDNFGKIEELPIFGMKINRGWLNSRLLIENDDSFDIGVIKYGLFKEKYLFLNLNKNQ